MKTLQKILATILLGAACSSCDLTLIPEDTVTPQTSLQDGNRSAAVDQPVLYDARITRQRRRPQCRRYGRQEHGRRNIGNPHGLQRKRLDLDRPAQNQLLSGEFAEPHRRSRPHQVRRRGLLLPRLFLLREGTPLRRRTLVRAGHRLRRGGVAEKAPRRSRHHHGSRDERPQKRNRNAAPRKGCRPRNPLVGPGFSNRVSPSTKARGANTGICPMPTSICNWPPTPHRPSSPKAATRSTRRERNPIGISFAATTPNRKRSFWPASTTSRD